MNRPQRKQQNPKKRTRKPPTEYGLLRTKHRQATERYIVPLKPSLTEDQRRHLEALEHKHVTVYKSLTATARKATKNLNDCQQYRKAKQRYGILMSHKDKNGNLPPDETTEMTSLKETLKHWQEYFGITKLRFRKQAEHLSKKQNYPSVFALSDMEMTWKAIETVLYGNGKKIGSRDYKFTRPIIKAKQINSMLLLKVDKQQNLLFVKLGKEKIYLEKPERDDDPWLWIEYKSLISYLLATNPEDAFLKAYAETGTPQNTHRPCYVQIASEFYRGSWHYEFQIVVEGRPYPKVDKDGVFRHDFPDDGEVNVDLGTQTFAAYCSDGFIAFSNLGERDYRSSFDTEARQRRIQRSMDRSRRANNPECYNPDGTIKRGKKEWHDSQRYRKLHKQYHDLCRKNRINRRLGNAERANELRSHGANLVTEDVSVMSWARKAKRGKVVDEDGREHYRRRKRHGHSIQNRCPGQFLGMLRQKCDTVTYVDKMYRASQYDHMSDEYKKKPLGQRTHTFVDGRKVPRDLYSAFLMSCHDVGFLSPDRGRCLSEFDAFYKRVRDLTGWLEREGVSVRNSGL